MVHYAKMI